MIIEVLSDLAAAPDVDLHQQSEQGKYSDPPLQSSATIAMYKMTSKARSTKEVPLH